jgi:hypothetical protein
VCLSKGEREKGKGKGERGLGNSGPPLGIRGNGDWWDKEDKGELFSIEIFILNLSPFPLSFKGRVFKISKIVEKILKCFTWFGCFRIFKSAEMVKKLPNTKSLPLKASPFPLPQTTS